MDDRLTQRAQLAVALAHINQQLGAISLDGNLIDFATDEQLADFRTTISRARREVQRAELDLHDLMLDPAALA